MYDNITKSMIIRNFDFALDKLLPPYFISNELRDLWYKCMQHMFKYCIFKNKNKNHYYLLKDT